MSAEIEPTEIPKYLGATRGAGGRSAGDDVVGIVLGAGGPWGVATYFVLRSARSVPRWIVVVGSALGFVGIVALAVRSARSLKRKIERIDQLAKRGLRATARVLATEAEGGRTGSVDSTHHFKLKVRLEAHAEGRDAWEIDHSAWFTSKERRNLEPGAVVELAVNPDDPNEVVVLSVGQPGSWRGGV